MEIKHIHNLQLCIPHHTNKHIHNLRQCIPHRPNEAVLPVKPQTAPFLPFPVSKATCITSPLALPSFLKHGWSHSSPGNMHVMFLPYCSAKGLYSFPLFIMDRFPPPCISAHEQAWFHWHLPLVGYLMPHAQVLVIRLCFLFRNLDQLVILGQCRIRIKFCPSFVVLRMFFSRLHVCSAEEIHLGR